MLGLECEQGGHGVLTDDNIASTFGSFGKEQQLGSFLEVGDWRYSGVRLGFSSDDVHLDDDVGKRFGDMECLLT